MKNSELNPDSEASGCRAVIEISISNPTVKLQDKLQGLQEITALQPPPFRRLLASTSAASSPMRPGRYSKASTPTMMTRSPSTNVLTALELKVRTLHHHFCNSPLLPISSKQQRRRQSLRHQGSLPSRPHQHRRSSLPITPAPSLAADGPPLGHSKPTATPPPLLCSTAPGTGPTGSAPQAPLVHQSHRQPD
ncbi:hypothetical protein ACFX12_022997 [Malus domestica]